METGALDVAQVLAAFSTGAGKGVLAPAIAGALDSPDVQASVRRTAWTAGLVLGACVAVGVAAAIYFTRR